MANELRQEMEQMKQFMLRQEDEIIRLIELHQKERLSKDPMRELEEALMDRTTASLNRKKN